MRCAICEDRRPRVLPSASTRNQSPRTWPDLANTVDVVSISLTPPPDPKELPPVPDAPPGAFGTVPKKAGKCTQAGLPLQSACPYLVAGPETATLPIYKGAGRTIGTPGSDCCSATAPGP